MATRPTASRGDARAYQLHAPGFTRPSTEARAAALAKRAADYERSLNRLQSASSATPTADRPDSSGVIVLHGTRLVPASAEAARGSVDPRALTLEARAWLREVDDPSHADKAFTAARAPTAVSSRMWADASVPDAAFAADADIGGGRQLRSTRAFIAPPK